MLFLNGIFLNCCLDKLVEMVYTFVMWCKTLRFQLKFQMLVMSQEIFIVWDSGKFNNS